MIYKIKKIMFVCYLVLYSGGLLPPYYIGSTSMENILNGYIGSVTSSRYGKIFKDEKSKNRHLFNVFILSEHENRIEAMNSELYFQKEFEAVRSDIFYNESYASPDGMFGRNVEGKNNPMFGRKHSEETKKLIREKRGNDRRYIPTEDHRKIFSETHKGKKLSEETRKKMSDKLRYLRSIGEIKSVSIQLSNEAKKKISDANKGRVFSDESRKKVSDANKGRIHSEETRKKISESKKGKKRLEYSDEWKKKISEGNMGKKMSQESINKMIQTKKNNGGYKKSVCNYCGLEGAGGNMKRYHFENCKNKNI